jgi:hypothetical protein
MAKYQQNENNGIKLSKSKMWRRMAKINQIIESEMKAAKYQNGVAMAWHHRKRKSIEK